MISICLEQCLTLTEIWADRYTSVLHDPVTASEGALCAIRIDASAPPGRANIRYMITSEGRTSPKEMHDLPDDVLADVSRICVESMSSPEWKSAIRSAMWAHGSPAVFGQTCHAYFLRDGIFVCPAMIGPLDIDGAGMLSACRLMSWRPKSEHMRISAFSELQPLAAWIARDVLGVDDVVSLLGAETYHA